MAITDQRLKELVTTQQRPTQEGVRTLLHEIQPPPAYVPNLASIQVAVPSLSQLRLAELGPTENGLN